MGQMVRAREGFVSGITGEEVIVARGEIVDSDHEIVRKTPAEWWEPLTSRFTVEQATAAPGERRPVRVRAKAAEE